MANQRLINSLSEIARRNRENNFNEIASRIANQTWASVGIALYNVLEGNHDEKVEQLTTFFSDVQEIWNKSLNHEYEVVTEFEHLTGLSILTPIEDIEDEQ